MNQKKNEDLQNNDNQVDSAPQKKYAMKRKRTAYLFGGVSIAAFFSVLIGGCVLGFCLPLRPEESDIEKRKLAEFPTFSVSTFLDGSYLSDVSLWYADSYPFRDMWMAGNDTISDLHGIRTVQVVNSGGKTADAIPTVGAKTTVAADKSTAAETKTAAATTAPAASENTSAPKETEATEGTTAPKETAAAESTTAPKETAADPAPTEAATKAPEATESAVAAATDDAGNVEAPTNGGAVLPEMQAQVSGSMYIDGDAAYGIYYFSLDAANIYSAMVSRVADELQGKVNVYDILIPDSSYVYLTADQMAGLGGSDQLQAEEYYFGSMSDSVKKVSIMDTMMEHSSEYIYYRTDHHWTALGAYYAYQDWAAVKGIEAHDLSQFEEQQYPGFLGSYYSASKSEALKSNPDTVYAYVPMGTNRMEFTQTDGQTLSWPIINDVSNYGAGVKYSCFSGSDNPYSVIQNPAIADGSTCMVIKESFGNAFIPFLVDHYQTIYIIDYRYYDSNAKQYALDHGVQDILFVNNLEAISSKDYMERLDLMMQ